MIITEMMINLLNGAKAIKNTKPKMHKLKMS